MMLNQRVRLRAAPSALPGRSAGAGRRTTTAGDRRVGATPSASAAVDDYSSFFFFDARNGPLRHRRLCIRVRLLLLLRNRSESSMATIGCSSCACWSAVNDRP